MPAEECIAGSDAAGRAKRASSEKQTEYNLSRDRDQRKGTSKGSVCNGFTKKLQKKGQNRKEVRKTSITNLDKPSYML